MAEISSGTCSLTWAPCGRIMRAAIRLSQEQLPAKEEHHPMRRNDPVPGRTRPIGKPNKAERNAEKGRSRARSTVKT
jgi:hypothetical protein